MQDSGTDRKKTDWDRIFVLLKSGLRENPKPSISQVAETDSDPYRVLFSTILSLRTRDEVTIAASNRLFEAAPDLESLDALTEPAIEKLIYPAAFYRNKAVSIKKCVKILLEQYGGSIPGDRDELLRLPGVGRKTANLTPEPGLRY